jgi:DNA mismatch endonuclease (patch repair protein)
MTDVVDSITRSRMMSGIRGRNTRPELRVRQYLHAAGLRFRLDASDLPGRPDIVFRRRQLAVFVHGCFWHRHPGCRFATMPATRIEFWQRKFEANTARDARVVTRLQGLGWSVLTIWECETRDVEALDRLVWHIHAVSP